MEGDSALIISGLFGTGGFAAVAAIISNHLIKVRELKVQQAAHDAERIKIETQKAEAEEKKTVAEKDLFNVVNNKYTRLIHHPVFAMLDEIEFYFLKDFEVADEARTLIIQEFVVNKIRVWRDVLKRYAIEGEKCYNECGGTRMDRCNKSANLFKKMLLEGLERYETVWDLPNKLDVHGHRAYDAESLDTMKFFIPIFHEWHHSREETVRLASNEIPNAGLNLTCHGDWWDMFYVYLFAFVQMKYDAPVAMRALNGEMTGRKFFGLTVGDLH